MVMSILLWSCADDEEMEIENFEPYFYISFIDVANPGVVKIDTLFVVGSNGYILFQDSSDIFDFPLPVNTNEAIYTIVDNTLHLQPVTIFYSNLNTVVIKGLKDGTEYVSKPIEGGFEGMKVNVIKG